MQSLQGTSLTAKMLIVTLLVSIVIWSLLDPLQHKAIKSTFGAHLTERLEEEAYENRMLLDGYIDRFIQIAKILSSHRQLYDYVHSNLQLWSSSSNRSDNIQYHRKLPLWMPRSSVVRTLPDFYYVFLLDHNKLIREVYMKHQEWPPERLLKPSEFILNLSHQQAFLTEIDNFPYLIASETLHDDNGNVMATLLVTAPLNNRFVRESQGARYSRKLVALMREGDIEIIASSQPDILSNEAKLAALQNHYMYAGKDFFDYGSSDLRLKFVTFLPKRPHEILSASILKKERRNRIIMAIVLIVSFSVLMFWITQRIQRVTAKVKDFAEDRLEKKQPEIGGGDEVEELEQSFYALSHEIRASHDSLEVKIRERTDELEKTNILLKQEIKKHRKTESALRVSEEQIRRSLKEKDLLLQEVHHRVKNNMTVVSSLLSLQSNKITNPKYNEVFDENVNRIKTMARIHEKLYQADDLAGIVFSEYISELVDNICISYRLNPDEVSLKKQIERVVMGIDASIPCGLIVNELLSNSLKHAFPEGRRGEVRVILSTAKDNEVMMIISDNGVGMPENIDFTNTDSLGLNLVRTLVNQLQGEIRLNRENGTEFQITFKMPPSRNKSIS